MTPVDSEFLSNSELVAKSRIPAIYPFRELVDTGGLMSYSPDLPDLFRTLATPVAKILNGAKPQDIPFQQPTRFELVINLKTAKALGFELPASLVARAKRDLRPRCRRSN